MQKETNGRARPFVLKTLAVQARKAERRHKAKRKAVAEFLATQARIATREELDRDRSAQEQARIAEMEAQWAAKELERQDALRCAEKAELESKNLEQQAAKLARLRCALTQTRKAELEAKMLERQEALRLATQELEAKREAIDLGQQQALRFAAQALEAEREARELEQQALRVVARKTEPEANDLERQEALRLAARKAELEAKRLEQEALRLVTLEKLQVSKLERQEALRFAARKAEVQAKKEALERAYIRIGQRRRKLELLTTNDGNMVITQAELDRAQAETHSETSDKFRQAGERRQPAHPGPAVYTNADAIPTGSSIISVIVFLIVSVSLPHYLVVILQGCTH